VADELCAVCGNCTLYARTTHNDSIVLSSTISADCFNSSVVADRKYDVAPLTDVMSSAIATPRRTTTTWTIEPTGGDYIRLVVDGRSHRSTLGGAAGGRLERQPPRRSTSAELRVRDGVGPLSNLLLLTTDADRLSAASTADASTNFVTWTLIGEHRQIVVELTETEDDVSQPAHYDDELDNSDGEIPADVGYVTWTLTYSSIGRIVITRFIFYVSHLCACCLNERNCAWAVA
jgi:hypothetical protein